MLSRLVTVTLASAQETDGMAATGFDWMALSTSASGGESPPRFPHLGPV